MMRWIGVATVAVAFALLGAGCGGSNDSGSDAAAETLVSTEKTMTDATSTEETSTETSGSLSGLSDECKDLVEASQSFATAAGSAGSGNDDNLDSVAAAYSQLAEQAPDDLKDDFKVLAEVMSEYAAAIGDLDLGAGEVPNADQIAKLSQIGQSFSAENVQKASAAIATWSTENCGA